MLDLQHQRLEHVCGEGQVMVARGCRLAFKSNDIEIVAVDPGSTPFKSLFRTNGDSYLVGPNVPAAVHSRLKQIDILKINADELINGLDEVKAAARAVGQVQDTLNRHRVQTLSLQVLATHKLAGEDGRLALENEKALACRRDDIQALHKRMAKLQWAIDNKILKRRPSRAGKATLSKQPVLLMLLASARLNTILYRKEAF
ncbi:hypothetical protein HDU89_002968 [Geranomyces variabilis]|nr:hypothetical protein HDU89_002968 [Geranomyces variabilis]